MFSVVRRGFVGAAVGTGGGPRQGGSGPRDAVGRAAPVMSSVRCEVTMTLRAGSKISSLSSPPREIALHGHAGAEFFRPEKRTERGADLGDKVGFDLVPVVQGRGGRRGAVQRVRRPWGG